MNTRTPANDTEGRVRRVLKGVDIAALEVERPLKSSSDSLKTWVCAERQRLGVDEAVDEWNDKPLLYHLKKNAARFLPIMRIVSLYPSNASSH